MSPLIWSQLQIDSEKISNAATLSHDWVLPPSHSPLFGTDGIRGKVGTLLTESLAKQVGYWVGQVLQVLAGQPGPVLIGQDSRNSSEMLATAVATGLIASGLEVWDLGLCPTPAVAYLTHTSNAIGGVMISASHNPPEDNGIKFFNQDGSKLSQTAQCAIERALHQFPNREEFIDLDYCKRYARSELLEDYLVAIQHPLQVESLLEKPLQGLRVVLDLAWGAAIDLAPRAFRNLGAEVICLHEQADGDRINVNCGSTHLAPLQTAVQEFHADLGFAFDGDADRTLAVDHQGRAVDGDYILYLWGQKLQQQGQLPQRLIVATVMSNLGFEQAWKKQGGTLVRTPVGDQHVHTRMMELGGVLGGEQSGHILCRHYGVTGDGLATALHVAMLVHQSKVSLAELANQSFQLYPQRLCNVRVTDQTALANWKHCFALQQAIEQAEADLGNQGRILVRASGTEPLLRIMVEAPAAATVSFWTDHLVSVVKKHL